MIKTKIDKLTSDIDMQKFKEKIKEIKTVLFNKLDIEKELPNLMRVLVEKVEIEKINNDRNRVRLTIYFDFKTNIINKELKLDTRVIKTSKILKVN